MEGLSLLVAQNWAACEFSAFPGLREVLKFSPRAVEWITLKPKTLKTLNPKP